MTGHELDDLEDRVSRALDVPEPSPLFWEHFPGRVRAAVTAAPPAPAAAWWRRKGLVFALSLALVAALSSWAWTRRAPVGVDDVVPSVAAETTPSYSDEAHGSDPGWQLVGSVAASAGVEGLREAGFGVAPGGADAAIDALTDTERAQLLVLLQAEMKGDDPGGL